MVISPQPENSNQCGVDLNDKAKVLKLAHAIRRKCKLVQAQSLGLLHTAILLLEMVDTPSRDVEHCLAEIFLARFFHLRWDVDLDKAQNILHNLEVCSCQGLNLMPSHI